MKLAELSFSAFRVALIDPTARVRASASVPRTIPRVLGVAMTGGFLHEEKIHFSDNLNCLIGGRGAGKSTAIRAIAYALGLNDDFGDFDNCPDSVTLFCEDANGVAYRYVRTRGGDIDVKAKEDRSVIDVPVDAFHVEYFGQGELGKVAEDPLKHPELFQQFLDRHTSLRDLVETEEALVTSLRENAGRLNPLETAFAQLAAKKQSLLEIEKKLKIAEEGNLRVECPAILVPVEMRQTGMRGAWHGTREEHTAEQIVSLLRQIEVGTANGKLTPQACKEVGITEQTYYRWRKEFGGLQVDQARRLKELEQENAKLKRLVAELSLDKLVLKDIASGNF